MLPAQSTNALDKNSIMYTKLYLLPLLLLAALFLFILAGFQQPMDQAEPPEELEKAYQYLDYGQLDSARHWVELLQKKYRQQNKQQAVRDLEVVLAKIHLRESPSLAEALQPLQKIGRWEAQLSDTARNDWQGLFVLAHARFGEWEKAQQLYQKLEASQPKKQLDLLFELLYTATNQEAPKALSLYAETALSYLEQHPKLKADTMRWIDVLAYQAIAKDYQNQPDEALRIYQRIAPILEQRNDSIARQSLYTIYNDMATVYQALDDIGKSIEYYQKALLTMEGAATTVEYYQNRMVILSNLAYTQELLKQHKAALRSNHKGLALAEKALIPLRAERLFLLENIAFIHLNQGNSDSVKYYIKEIEQEYRQGFELTSLRAEMALLDNNPRKALALYQQMRAELIEQGFSELDANSRVAPVLIDIYLKLEQPKKALALLDDNRQMQHPLTYPPFDSLDYPNMYLESIEKRLYIAHLYPELITPAAFLDDARYAVQLLEKIRRSFSGNISKRSILQYLSSTYGYAVEAALRHQRVEEAFLFAEKAKSALLNEHLQERDALEQHSIDPAIAEKERSLQRDLAYYRHQRFVLQDYPEEQKAAQSKYLALKSEWRDLQEQLDEKYPHYYQLKYAQIEPNLQAIQAQLPAGSLVLEYLETESQLFVFALDKEKLRHWTVPLPENYRARIAVFQQALSDPEVHQQKPYENRVHLAQQGHALYELYVPDSALLEAYQQLIIVPDGQMHYLPFEVLLDRPVDADRAFRDWPFLIQKWDISYLYTTQLWLQMQQRERRPRAAMLAFAPSYKAGAAENRSALTQRLRFQLQDLPGARKEVQQLEKMLPGKFHYGEQANEPHFKDEAADYQILHLAMHGVVNNDNPSYSNLVFTETGGTDDNLLHAYELQQMHLSAELAFLSACETGYGQYQAGEGVASLARSFMYAGVPSVVQSLWKVSDFAGAKVVEQYYKELLKDKNKAVALRQAKLNYLKKVEGMAQHPFYWASFVQLGDTQAIEIASEGPNALPWILAGAALALLLFLWWYRKRLNLE